MLPTITNNAFNTTQNIDWQITWYESNMMIPETGLGFRLGTPSSSFTNTGMANAADSSVYMESNSVPVITDSGGNWKYGRVALAQEFWDSGALPGISRSRFSVLHWRGFTAADRSWTEGTGNFYLGFVGNGHIKVVYNGTTILNDRLDPKVVKYTSLVSSPSTGQQLDIYYWQLGELWGGVVGKYIPEKYTNHVPDDLDHRFAPVISASLFPFSISSGVVLPRIITARLNRNSPTDAMTMDFSLPLSEQNSLDGWRLLSNPRRLQYTQGMTTYVLKRGQLVVLEGGFTNDLYNRFTGFINDLEENDGVVTISCLASESKLNAIQVENYPDKLSYGTFAFFADDATSEPIYETRAYDFWPVELAITDLLYRAKVDSKLVNAIKTYNNSGVVEDQYDRLGTLTVKDNFTDTNGTAIIDHIPDVTVNSSDRWQDSGPTIQSNQLSHTGSLVRERIISEVIDNFTIQSVFNFPGSATDGTVGFIWRSVDSGSFTGYEVRFDRTSTSLVTMVLNSVSGGTPTQITSQSGISWNSGTARKVTVEVSGDEINVYIADSNGLNRSLLTTQTDSSISHNRDRVGFILTGATAGAVTADGFELYRWRPAYKFDCTTISQKLIKLQRSAHYGNIGSGFSESIPLDDPYIYPPQVSKSIFDWTKELAEGIGYDLFSDQDGDFVLSSRNNPDGARDLSASAGTLSFNADCFGGTFADISSGFNITKEVFAARIDLIVGRRDDLGVVAFTIRDSSGSTVSSGTVNLNSPTQSTGLFFYDNRFTLDGSNATVATLFTGDFGYYTVSINNSSGSRWFLDSIFTYDFDPITSNYPESFSTDRAIISLSTESQAEDIRNHVIVVGKRKAALTDSSKTINPNNPEYEFFVSTGTDPSSIWDPDSDNYFGSKLASVIVDDKVADQDYADWLSQALLIRQRDPDPIARIQHTILPMIESRDPVIIADQRFSSITGNDRAWVVGYTEEYTIDSAISTVHTTGYQEIPSYEPKEDISLALIESQFGGNPVIDVNITYPSLDNNTVTNPGPNLPASYTTESTLSLTISTDGNGEYVSLSGQPWPPIPDSIRINVPSGTVGPNATDVRFNALKNNPYFKFTHVYDYTVQRIHLPFETGPGTASIYDRTGWGLSSPLSVTYRGLNVGADPYGGVSPFYDPYMSEIGEGLLINLSFDALVSGYYRVSVWDYRHDGTDPTRIAWLTEPGLDPDNVESHWSYINSGNNRIFSWDGVDNIGDWNEKQSEDYSWVARGVFQLVERPSVSRGFYAWNDRTSSLVTISSQLSNGKLVFNDDHYSQFYVLIETRADVFADTTRPVREVRTDSLRTDNSENPQNEIYIYTHLPKPTTVKISSIEDWDFAANGAYFNGTTVDGWESILTGSQVTAPDRAATIRNNKPVRISYEAIARPGVRFNGDAALTSFKLNRVVHLDAHILDSFLLFYNQPWYPDAVAQQKRLVNRRLTNSQNTLVSSDTDFRTGDTLSSDINKWIFVPEDFTIDGESVRFADFLQLEDVPSFTVNPEIGETDSRHLLAYISYLFYISTYTQDRSGRLVWCVYPDFVDQSKITQGTFQTEFPEDLENYFRSTVITRQWVEQSHISDVATEWNITAGNQKYIQFYHHRLDFEDDISGNPLTLDENNNSVTGDLLTVYTDDHSDHSNTGLPAGRIVTRQLGEWTGSSLTNYFGDWTWEGDQLTPVGENTNHDPLWIPCPTRDWFPFLLIPPLTLGSDLGGYFTYLRTDFDDPTKYEIWFADGQPMTAALGNKFLRPGRNVEFEVGGDGSRRQVGSAEFDYTRQNEWVLWENVRGGISQRGNLDETSYNTVIVKPSHRYFVNTFLYDKFVFSKLGPQDASQNTTVAFFNLLGEKSHGVPGHFRWTFRHIYNWESSSFFPVDSSRNNALRPEYLYLKYDGRRLVENIVFDAGAWAGWKDDRTTAISADEFEWTSSVPFRPSSGNRSAGGSFDGDYNIFLEQMPPMAVIPPIPPIATGNNNVTQNVIVSLMLVNSRRLNPIPGHV